MFDKLYYFGVAQLLHVLYISKHITINRTFQTINRRFLLDDSSTQMGTYGIDSLAEINNISVVLTESSFGFINCRLKGNHK